MTSTVNVVAVNDAPVLTAGATLAFTEGGSATVVDGTVTVSDVDSVNLTSATVQITANDANGEDVPLSSTPVASLALCTGHWHLDADWCCHAGQPSAALRSVTYNNTSITADALRDGDVDRQRRCASERSRHVDHQRDRSQQSAHDNSIAPATATEGAYTYGAHVSTPTARVKRGACLAPTPALVLPLFQLPVYTFTPAGPVPRHPAWWPFRSATAAPRISARRRRRRSRLRRSTTRR